MLFSSSSSRRVRNVSLIALVVAAGIVSCAKAQSSLDDQMCYDSRFRPYSIPMTTWAQLVVHGPYDCDVASVYASYVEFYRDLVCTYSFPPLHVWATQVLGDRVYLSGQADATTNCRGLSVGAGNAFASAYQGEIVARTELHTIQILDSWGSAFWNAERYDSYGAAIAKAHFVPSGAVTLDFDASITLSSTPDFPTVRRRDTGSILVFPGISPLVNGVIRGRRSVGTIGNVVVDMNTHTATSHESFNVSAAWSGEPEIFQFDFSDGDYDFNADGRFNQSDVTFATANLLGSTLPALLAKIDFNSSGTVDDTDIARLQTLIDAGLGSGVFADFSGDGVVNPCADRTNWSNHLNAAVGSSNYVVELDFNLDGLIDSTDVDALEYRLPTADVDDGSFTGVRDGGVTIDDLLLLHLSVRCR